MPERAQKEGQRVPGIEREPERAKQCRKGARECPWDQTRAQRAKESQGSRVKIPQEWTLKIDRPQVSTLKTPGGGNYKRRK